MQLTLNRVYPPGFGNSVSIVLDITHNPEDPTQIISNFSTWDRVLSINYSSSPAVPKLIGGWMPGPGGSVAYWQRYTLAFDFYTFKPQALDIIPISSSQIESAVLNVTMGNYQRRDVTGTFGDVASLPPGHTIYAQPSYYIPYPADINWSSSYPDSVPYVDAGNISPGLFGVKVVSGEYKLVAMERLSTGGAAKAGHNAVLDITSAVRKMKETHDQVVAFQLVPLPPLLPGAPEVDLSGDPDDTIANMLLSIVDNTGLDWPYDRDTGGKWWTGTTISHEWTWDTVLIGSGGMKLSGEPSIGDYDYIHQEIPPPQD